MLGPIFFAFVHLQAGINYYLSILGAAIFSDYLDGALAKIMQEETEFGARLDPLCDKIFAAWAVAACWRSLIIWPLNALAFIVFEGTLLSLSVALSWAKRKGQYHGKAQVKANSLGKWKINFQAAVCFCFLYNWTITGQYILVVANLFAVGSLIRHLTPKEKS
jgi:phosphatidylglycerophosphate synthase